MKEHAPKGQTEHLGDFNLQYRYEQISPHRSRIEDKKNHLELEMKPATYITT